MENPEGTRDTTSGRAITSEAEVLNEIERSIRATRKAYGYQHLATIGNHLRSRYPDFQLADYGCKNLLQFIERYPERFKIKWAAPAHKGRSHVWVRLASELKQKPKEKQENTSPKPHPKQANPQPRLMTARELNQLCSWLSESGMPDTCDGSLRKTRQWLRRRNFLDLNANVNWLQNAGGYCDCEVLYNVSDNWLLYEE